MIGWASGHGSGFGKRPRLKTGLQTLKNGNWNCEFCDNKNLESKTPETRVSKTRKGGVSCGIFKCLFSMFPNFNCPYSGVSCGTERHPGDTRSELEKGPQRTETSIYTAFNANGIGAPSGQKTARKSTEEKSVRTGPKLTKNEQKSTVQNTSKNGPKTTSGTQETQ
jgi:hypothetical protein